MDIITYALAKKYTDKSGGGDTLQGKALELTSVLTGRKGTVKAGVLTDERSYTLPNKSGTLALASDLEEIDNTKLSITNNAGFHNSIYRGKSLGTSISTDQWSAISSGTFDDMYIGDYWEINGNIYRIAHFDYWFGTGDDKCTTHHVVLVPDDILDTKRMNSSDTTSGGYYNSEMHLSNLSSAESIVYQAFGGSSDHILNHRELLTNTDFGQFFGWGWYDSTVELMNESMVYGHPVWAQSGYETGVCMTILALFQLDPSKISICASPWWLRSVVSSTNFARVAQGSARNDPASNAYGVRPVFAIY